MRLQIMLACMCLMACGSSFQSSSEELSEASVKLEASVWLEANVSEVGVVDAGTDVMLPASIFEASSDVESIKEATVDVVMNVCSSAIFTAICDGAICIAPPCNDLRSYYWSCDGNDTPPNSANCVSEGFNHGDETYCCENSNE
jgi:hypothetical protein